MKKLLVLLLLAGLALSQQEFYNPKTTTTQGGLLGSLLKTASKISVEKLSHISNNFHENIEDTTRKIKEIYGHYDSFDGIPENIRNDLKWLVIQHYISDKIFDDNQKLGLYGARIREIGLRYEKYNEIPEVARRELDELVIQDYISKISENEANGPYDRQIKNIFERYGTYESIPIEVRQNLGSLFLRQYLISTKFRKSFDIPDPVRHKSEGFLEKLLNINNYSSAVDKLRSYITDIGVIYKRYARYEDIPENVRNVLHWLVIKSNIIEILTHRAAGQYDTQIRAICERYDDFDQIPNEVRQKLGGLVIQRYISAGKKGGYFEQIRQIYDNYANNDFILDKARRKMYDLLVQQFIAENIDLQVSEQVILANVNGHTSPSPNIPAFGNNINSSPLLVETLSVDNKSKVKEVYDKYETYENIPNIVRHYLIELLFQEYLANQPTGPISVKIRKLYRKYGNYHDIPDDMKDQIGKTIYQDYVSTHLHPIDDLLGNSQNLTIISHEKEKSLDIKISEILQQYGRYDEVPIAVRHRLHLLLLQKYIVDLLNQSTQSLFKKKIEELYLSHNYLDRLLDLRDLVVQDYIFREKNKIVPSYYGDKVIKIYGHYGTFDNIPDTIRTNLYKLIVRDLLTKYYSNFIRSPLEELQEDANECKDNEFGNNSFLDPRTEKAQPLSNRSA